MLKIIKAKKSVKNENDFQKLLDLIYIYKDLNYSKNRKKRIMTPVETKR